MEAPLSRGRFCFPPAGFGAVSQVVRRSLFGAIPRIARIQQSVGIDEHLFNDGHMPLGG